MKERQLNYAIFCDSPTTPRHFNIFLSSPGVANNFNSSIDVWHWDAKDHHEHWSADHAAGSRQYNFISESPATPAARKCDAGAEDCCAKRSWWRTKAVGVSVPTAGSADGRETNHHSKRQRPAAAVHSAESELITAAAAVRDDRRAETHPANVRNTHSSAADQDSNKSCPAATTNPVPDSGVASTTATAADCRAEQWQQSRAAAGAGQDSGDESQRAASAGEERRQ